VAQPQPPALGRAVARRSEAAWTALADKARLSQRLRSEEHERKAASAAATNDEITTEQNGLEGPHALQDGETAPA
jgi:hypothetical protein